MSAGDLSDTTELEFKICEQEYINTTQLSTGLLSKVNLHLHIYGPKVPERQNVGHRDLWPFLGHGVQDMIKHLR